MLDRLQELQTVKAGVLASLQTLDTWTKDQNWNEYPASSPDSIESSELLRSMENNLLESLCGIRTAINALVPVNRLPTDILRSIFDWLSPPRIGHFLPPIQGHRVDFSRHAVGSSSPQLHLYHWLRITSVCRRWRQVAISSSTSWSTIAIGPACTPPQLLDSHVRYSGTAPIDLHVWPQEFHRDVIPRKHFKWGSVDIRPLISRLRSFHLHSYNWTMEAERIFNQLTDPAPLLEHLSLAPGHLELSVRSLFAEVDDLPQVRDSRLILPRLFADEMPRLQSLAICGFHSWPENNFQNLVRISISEQSLQPRRHTSSSHGWKKTFLLNFLNNSPRLEELVLSNALPLKDDGSTFALQLPRLKMLVLALWDQASVTLFLSALEIPTSCLVFLQLTNKGADVLDTICSGRSLRNMSCLLQSMTRMCLRTAYRMLSHEPDMLICGEGGLYFKASSRWIYDHNLTTDLHITANNAAFFSAMALQELWIDIEGGPLPPVQVSQWQEYYAAMPGISKLVLVARGLRPMLEPLEALREQDGPTSCLPDLAELHIVLAGTDTSELLLVLRQVKTEREELGRPIRLVVGTRPPLVLYEETIMELREKLGADVDCEAIDISFDWSPFSNREPYCIPHWPDQLYGDSPGLWSGRVREY